MQNRFKICSIFIIILLIITFFSGCINNEKIMDIDKIQTSLNLAENWLKENLNSEGYFNYLYNPDIDNYSENNNMIRQLMASRVYADLSKTDNSLQDSHKKNLQYVFQNWYNEKDDLGFIFYNGKSKLGSIAMAVRTLVYSPFFDEYENEYDKLINCILNLQNDNGSFEPWYIEPYYNYDKDYILTFYSGEALLSLAEAYQKTDNQSILDAAINSQDFYIDRYVTNLEENYYPAYVPWHTQSLNVLYKITKNESYANSIFVLNDKLLELLDTKNQDTLGRFYNDSTPQYGTPHSSSDAVYTEGLAYAYEIAVLVNDKAHIQKYEKAINLAAENLIRLQYTEENTQNFTHPEKLIGAIKWNADDNRIRVDTTQHMIDAFRKIVEVF